MNDKAFTKKVLGLLDFVEAATINFGENPWSLYELEEMGYQATRVVGTDNFCITNKKDGNT